MLNLIPFTGVFSDLVKLISEAIPDPDKKVELTVRALELQNQLTTAVLQTQTVPWVDAIVKLIASLSIFMRPIGSAAMTAFGIYMHWKQLPMDTGVHMLFDGAFPAWGTSRHFARQQEVEKAAEIEKVKIEKGYPVHWGSE